MIPKSIEYDEWGHFFTSVLQMVQQMELGCIAMVNSLQVSCLSNKYVNIQVLHALSHQQISFPVCIGFMLVIGLLR